MGTVVSVMFYDPVSTRKKKMEEMLGGATWDARYDEIDFNFRQKECRPQVKKSVQVLEYISRPLYFYHSHLSVPNIHILYYFCQRRSPLPQRPLQA